MSAPTARIGVSAQDQPTPKRGRRNVLLFIAVVLIVLWLLGFLAFHMGPLVNILLIAAIVVVIWHFVSRGVGRN